MKYLFLSVFFTFFLTACSDFKTFEPGKVTVDPAFNFLLQQYKNDKLRFTGTAEIRPISILFFTQDAPVIGVCTIYNGTRIIYMDPAFWFNSSYHNQLTLLYHEMGHCDLNILDHVPTYTLMNAYHFSGSTFASNPDFYLHELFVNRR